MKSHASSNGPAHGGPLRRALGRTFQSLESRNFRLFFFGQLISNTGNWLTNVALILFVLQLTHSGFAVGLLSACQFGPMFFLAAWAGAVADRTDKRRMLLWTQSLEMAQSVGLAVLAFLPHPSLVALYAIALAGGVLLAFDNPLRRSFVPEMVSPDELPNAVVLYSTIVNLSLIFGPALAGLLAVTVGYGWCFTLDAASYVAVIGALVAMRPAELHRQPPRPRSGREVREGLRYVMSEPALWISNAMYAAIGLFLFNLRVMLPLFVTDSLHSSDTVFTVLYSLSSCGAVVGALFVAHRNLVHIRHVIVGAVLLGASMLLLSVMPTVSATVPAVFLVGMASIVYGTATNSVAQVGVRRDMHGRVLALQTVLMGGTSLVGGPILGRLADVAGGRAPIALGGVVCLATAALGHAAARRHPGPA
ncbi:MAG TPA: MFS transporter [Gemmatimonadaceae bacterium]|nr:MFS transporter [Gemmatimonadaceae bacterium]